MVNVSQEHIDVELEIFKDTCSVQNNFVEENLFGEIRKFESFYLNA
jgi:hypothetical protein